MLVEDLPRVVVMVVKVNDQLGRFDFRQRRAQRGRTVRDHPALLAWNRLPYRAAEKVGDFARRPPTQVVRLVADNVVESARRLAAELLDEPVGAIARRLDDASAAHLRP